MEDSVSRGFIKDDKNKIRQRIDLIKKNPKGLVVLIKTVDDAKYQNLVKILDKISLSDVGRYAMMDLISAWISEKISRDLFSAFASSI